MRYRAMRAIVPASVMAAVLGPVVWKEHVSASPWAIWAGPLLIGTAAGLTWLTARGVRWAPAALVVLAVADQGYYGLSVSVLPEAEQLDEYLSSAVVPQGDPSGRIGMDLVLSGDASPRNGNQLTLLGWSRVDGFVGGLEPRRLLDYRTLPALRIAGVQYVRRNATTLKIAGLRAIDEPWLEVPAPLDRARLLAEARVSSDPAADLARIAIEREALVDRPIDIDPGEAGEATLERDRPGRICVAVDPPGQRLLAISESYHPGWHAIVDGQPIEVVRVNGDFLGCVVEPGENEVRFEFRPRDLEAGRVFSATGLMILFALASVALTRPGACVTQE